MAPDILPPEISHTPSNQRPIPNTVNLPGAWPAIQAPPKACQQAVLTVEAGKRGHYSPWMLQLPSIMAPNPELDASRASGAVLPVDDCGQQQQRPELPKPCGQLADSSHMTP